MNLQLTLAWRYLNGRKLRTFLTTLAVVFGVMVIFGMNIILPTMLAGFQANLMAAGGVVDVTVTHVSGGGFPLEVAQKLDGISGVRAVSRPARADRQPASQLHGLLILPGRTASRLSTWLDWIQALHRPCRLTSSRTGDAFFKRAIWRPRSFHRPWLMRIAYRLEVRSRCHR